MDYAIMLAHFKFSFIAPVIQGNFLDASKSAYYKRVTEEPLTRPDGTAFPYRPKTLEFWEQQYRKGGMDALMPGARSDKGVPRNLPDTAMAEIYRLREKFPRLNATQIYFHLIQEGFITKNTSLRCVQRFIKSYGLKTGTAAAVKDRKAFEEAYFGAMFQADTCYFPHITENGKSRRTYLMMIVDDFSRMIVGARLFYSDSAENFQTLLKSAVSTYGICEKLYCDHGAPYSNNQLALITGSIGTVLLHAPVRDGAAKAKVERAFRSVKERWLYGLDIKQVVSLEEFNLLLTEHIREYNLTFHSGIGGTPMDRFLNSNEKIRKPVSREWLDECFMNRITRKVKRDATFNIDKISFDAPMRFIGQTVEIRFVPGKPGTTCIFHDKEVFPIRMTDKAANSKTKREKLPVIDYGRREGAHV
jgi:transposase InsO family protein